MGVTEQNIACPECGGIMGATQTEIGSYFICDCGNEIPINSAPQGSLEE